MWTPSPPSALRYAGSVATRVLPSPVAISAILPSCSTMPPISCTSKWRIPSARRAASRHTANASGNTSSISAPSANRLRSSSVLPRSAPSSSACIAGSSALIVDTTGNIRLTSRSCLVPKIFLRIASIIASTLYAPASRLLRTATAQQCPCVLQRDGRRASVAQHSRDLGRPLISGHHVSARARPTAVHALGDPHVLVRERGDRRQMGHAENLAPRRDSAELLTDPRRRVAADAGVDLIEDHGRRALVGGKDNLQRQHGPGELAARGDTRQRPYRLTGIGREAKLDPVPAARAPVLAREFQDHDLEERPLHAELPQLALHPRRQLRRRLPPRRAQSTRASVHFGLKISEAPLVLHQQLFVPLQPVELGGDLGAKLQHRLLRIPVLPLEADERVEPVVDRVEPPGLEDDRVAEHAKGGDRLVQLRARGLQRLHGRRERRVEPTELTQHTPGLGEPRRRRTGVVVQERADLVEPRGEPLGVLEPAPLRAQLFFFARTEAGGIEFGYLEAQKILTLCAIAAGTPAPLDIGRCLTQFRKRGGEMLAQRLGAGESIQQLELARRLEQALVLVLAVNLHQRVAKAFQQPDRDNSIVDECTMAPRARKLTPDHDLTVLGAQPGLLEHRHRRAGRREHRLDRRGLGIATNQIGLRARSAQEQDGVHQDRLASAGLAGEDVEAGDERDGDVLDDREVANPQLAQHPATMLGQRSAILKMYLTVRPT